MLLHVITRDYTLLHVITRYYTLLHVMCHGFGLAKQDDYIFETLLTIFIVSDIFWGSWAVEKIGLSLKPNHNKQNYTT